MWGKMPLKIQNLLAKQKEKWKNITELGHSWYAVSNKGRIRSNICRRRYPNGYHMLIKRTQILTPHLNNGIIIVKVTNSEGKRVKLNVRRIVAKHWLQPAFDPNKSVFYRDRENVFDVSPENLYQKGNEDRRKKLTDDDVRAIRKEHATTDATYKSLAEKYNVAVVTIAFIICGMKRSNVDGPYSRRRRNVQIECVRRGKKSQTNRKNIPMAQPITWKGETCPDDSSERDSGMAESN